MIQKCGTGRGFMGLVAYLGFMPEKESPSASHEMRGTLIATNMAGKTATQISREFGQWRKLKKTLGKAVFHSSLSLSPDDRQLSDEEFASVARDYLEGMGFQHCPYLVVRHDDTPSHQHIHIVACRINQAGETVSDSNSFRRGESIVRQLEQKYHLKEVAPSSKTPRRRRRQFGSHITTITTEEHTMKTTIANIVQEQIASSQTLKELIRNCGRAGVQIEPVMDENGEIVGLIYRHEGVTIPASDIGADYTLEGLCGKLHCDITALDRIYLMGRAQQTANHVPVVMLPAYYGDQKCRDAKRRLLDPKVKEFLMGLSQKDGVASVTISPKGIIIKTVDGGRIICDGVKIKAVKVNYAYAAILMMLIAFLLGWQAVAVIGIASFVTDCFKLALQRKVNVVPLNDQQDKWLTLIEATMDRQGSGSAGKLKAGLSSKLKQRRKLKTRRVGNSLKPKGA